MSTPPGTGPFDPDLHGIDPGLMDTFIAAMIRAHASIGGQAELIRMELSRVGVGTAALTPFKEIEDWAGAQVPRLRVRNELIRKQVPDWMPGWATGLVRYDESTVPFTSPQEARRAGAALSDLYQQYVKESTGKVVTDELKQRHRDLLAQLLSHRDDADFAAAFFAGLGTTGTQALPRHIKEFYEHGRTLPVSDAASSREAALGELSRMFGTATSAAARVPGMAKVMKDLERGGEGIDKDALSWLVSEGHFPTEWLAAVGRNNAVIPMLNGSLTPETVALGTTARFLDALGADPAAARLAIGALSSDWAPGSPWPGSLPLGLPKAGLSAVLARMDLFLARVEQRGDPGAFLRTRGSFARLLASASGVHDEKDGAHSRDAARFAFGVITAAPHFALTDAMRLRLAEIGGSYATEFAASAESLDPDSGKPSRFGGFDDELAGTEPAFRLSLTDGYRFLQTFADTNEHMEPFDRGMAALTQRLFAEGVRLDKDRLAHPPPKGLQRETAVEQLFSRLGMVSGMQFAAMKVVRGTADLADRAAFDAFEQALDKGMDTAMLFLPTAGGTPAAVGWMTLSWAIKDGLGAALEPEGRLPSVNEKELAQSRMVLHEIASGLVARGYTMEGAPVSFRPPTDPLIVDGGGRLRPFSEINRDPKRTEAFLRWLKANGSVDSEADRRTLGKLVEGAALKFSGGHDQTEKIIASQDAQLRKILTGGG
ncbi:hypothetical protein [Nonomuraea sp. NPDC050786]|uniref:hypothetical protein n=1 Tax=Nonomuraea sp. NPDC050786 TaxID=3154840 RepID=UPI0033F02C9D